MKSYGRKTLIAVMFIMAVTLSVDAQRGMQNLPDSSSPGRPGNWIDVDQLRQMRDMPDSIRMRIDRGIMGPYRYFPGRDMRDMRNIQRYGMRRGFYPEIRDRYSRPQYRIDRYYHGRERIQRPPLYRSRIDRPYIERVPGLTDKQREDINNIRQKQVEEMRKIREEQLQRMEKFREENRTEILDILTPEQRKWIESNTAPVK